MPAASWRAELSDAERKLVSGKAPACGTWGLLLRDHMFQALKSGDSDHVVDVVLLTCYLLDASGKLEAVLPQLEHALEQVAGSEAACGLLTAMKAAALAALGRSAEAAAALESAEGALARLGTPKHYRWSVICEAVRLQLLLEPSERIAELLLLSSDPKRKPDYIFFLSWYVPYLASKGRVEEGGTKADATIWMSWLSALGRRGVETSIEFPVSRLRLQALLALRLGDASKSRRLFALSAKWCADSGFAVEESIARIQFAEVSALLMPTTRSYWQASACNDWDSLVGIGVDPVPHIQGLRQAFDEGANAAECILTGRELDVTRLLKKNLTYKQVATQLAISAQTVQNHAHRIYSKLGTSGSTASIREAERLGLL